MPIQPDDHDDYAGIHHHHKRGIHYDLGAGFFHDNGWRHDNDHDSFYGLDLDHTPCELDHCWLNRNVVRRDFGVSE